MQIFTLPDGREVPAGTSFAAYVTLKPGPPPVRDMVQYPSNWLENATAADLARVGVTVREVADPEPAPPTVDDVAAERDRRIALGFSYDFGDARGVHLIGTTDQDMKNWSKVTSASQAAVALGEGGTTVFLILTNTGSATVSAIEWQRILLAANAVQQPLFAASFALQAMDPIPSDYTDDKYWPA